MNHFTLKRVDNLIRDLEDLKTDIRADQTTKTEALSALQRVIDSLNHNIKPAIVSHDIEEIG